MSIGRVLERKAKLETVGVEVFSSFDGQGKPSYAASQDVKARVVEEDKVTINADGTDVRTSLTVWVPQAETPKPAERDRLTYDSRTFIVVETAEAKRLNGAVAFVRAGARDE